MSLIAFFRSEDGVATVDWTVLLAALTGAGVALVTLLTDSLSLHSTSIRGELQDPHFETDWFDTLPAQP